MEKSYLSYKSIWSVSWPVILSLLAQNIVNLTDTVFLGHLGEIELGASAIASVYYMIFFMTGFGFANGIQILISRRNGEQRFREIGNIFSNGILVHDKNYHCRYIFLIISKIYVGLYLEKTLKIRIFITDF